MPLAGERVKASHLDFPITQVRAAAATAITPTATWTNVVFDTEDFDDDAMHLASGSGIVAQRAGRYELSGGIGFAANATGRRGARWTVNNTAVDGSEVIVMTTSSLTCSISVRTVVVELAVGDTVRLQGYQESGGSLNTSTTGETQPSALVRFLGEG